jgi:transposase
MDSHFKEEIKLEMPNVRQRRRKKKKASKAVFKKYEQNQMMLLPPSLEEMIEEKHMVRVVNEMIDKLNLQPLIETYKGGGTSSYNPVMLLKVWIYAILVKIYSGRQIAKALRENIHFMWLSGSNRPDFRTINQFRSGRLQGVIEEIFVETVLFLAENNYIDLKKYFVDGTKMLADANKHSYVWKKNTARYKEAVQKRVGKMLKEIEKLNEEEDRKYGNKDLEEIGEDCRLTGEDIKEQVKKLNKIIEQSNLGKAEKKKAKKTVSKIETKELPKIEKYESQEQVLQERNSYSKTDNDATFFKMKNKELLPAYTIIAGTEKQYILNYSIHQSASESDQFIKHIEQYYKYFEKYPKLISGDSAYGSEENSEYLENNTIGNYLKYNTFHYETTKAYKENKFHKDHFKYDEKTDSYQCPNGRRMIFQEEVEIQTRTGYKQTIRKYQSENCRGCSYARECKKAKGRRTIQINRKLDYYRAKMRENLTSEKGIELRKQRNVDVEPVFGDIKWNQGYRRFKLRGKEKVKVEMGLVSISHNLKKLALSIN